MRLLKRKNGTILIDVMMGAYLLVIAALIYAATLGMAVVSRAKADNNTKATAIVNRELESIKDLGHDGLTYDSLIASNLIDSSSTGPTYYFTNAGPTQDQVSTQLPGPNNIGTITVNDETDTVSQVTVKVTWTEKGIARSIQASTELAQLK